MTHSKLITAMISVINIGKTMLTFDYEEPNVQHHPLEGHRAGGRPIHMSKGGRLGGMRQSTCDAEPEFLKPHCFR